MPYRVPLRWLRQIDEVTLRPAPLEVQVLAGPTHQFLRIDQIARREVIRRAAATELFGDADQGVAAAADVDVIDDATNARLAGQRTGDAGAEDRARVVAGLDV